MMIPFLFSKNRQSVYLGGKRDGGDLGGTGKGEVVIRIYYMGKKPVSNKRKKKSGKKQNKQKIPPPPKKNPTKVAIGRLVNHIIFLDLIFISYLHEVCSVFTSWPRLNHTSWIWAVSCNKNCSPTFQISLSISEVTRVVKIPVSQRGSLGVHCGLVALRRSSLCLSS